MMNLDEQRRAAGFPDWQEIQCANLIIRNGQVVRDCAGKVVRFCPYCKAFQCGYHARHNQCDLCGGATERLGKWQS